MEEDNSESTDQSSDMDQREKEASEDDNDEESLNDLKLHLEEMYESSVSFMNIINQTPKRHVNLALILTQFFSRYSSAQKIGFLTAATALVTAQGVNAYWGSFSHSTLYIGCLMAVLMLAFIGVTIKYILSALVDIRRIKHGFCSLGYQIVNRNDNNNETSDASSRSPVIAYKDYSAMIRTMRFPKEDHKKYFILSVLALFLDNNDPYKATLFDDMPRQISYEFKTQSFTQEWKDALCALFPCAMTVLFAISMYMSYIAYTTLHQ